MPEPLAKDMEYLKDIATSMQQELDGQSEESYE